MLLNIPKYDGHQRGLVSMVYKFFEKKTKAVVSLRLQINLLLNLYLKMNNPLLENFKKEKCIQHSKTIFRVLM